MLATLTIPKAPNNEPALNHELLYAAGLEQVRRLSHRVWTDYNVHDPGVTILELLSYALTDLSYRASFPVADLLASASDNAKEMQKQFFTARKIFPNRPLTLLDYRKLLIDLKDVKNAWLQPAPLTYFADTTKGTLSKKKGSGPGIKPVDILGLYDVIIDFNDDFKGNSTKALVMDTVKECLQANRNLCEDFVSFHEVRTQDFLLCCELELTPEAEVSKVEAEVLFAVQEYLAPTVRNYTLDEMLSRRKKDGTLFTTDEVFNGPALDCGFIDDDELAQADLRAKIYLSDVISIIMDIEGVRAVRDIVINPRGTATALANKWIVPVAARKKARLHRKRSRLVFYKRNMPVIADPAKVTQRYDELVKEATTKAEKMVAYDLNIPLGNYRDPASYYSFQNHFPALYGLSEYGLNGAPSEQRKALAYQLKAYLLFFDQVMANYLAQLSHVKELLSADPSLQRGYFTQVVDSFVDFNRIYSNPTNARAALEGIAEDDDMFVERRNRFLDHLIARFAEQFTEYALVAHAALGVTPKGVIGLKCDFLSDYPVRSSERSLAYNYALKSSGELWDSENVSGLERRLAKLLGIRNFARRNLGDITYDIYAEIDTTPDDEFRWRIRERNNHGVVLSSSTKYVTRELAKKEMQAAISQALTPSGYERKTTKGGKHYFNIVDATGQVVGRRIEYFDTADELEQAITDLTQYLRANYSDEGMYLIEMILLRPEQESDPFLPICPDPNCIECSEEDPYSYRIHVILPAYSSRFSNMDFRRFVEEVIRQETPAHILPRICWISQEDMVALESAYRAWIYLKAAADKADRTTKLQNFIDTLFKVRNVYPSQKLHECDAPEEERKFLLGLTALGTMTD
jgi:uncharacterized protein